MYTCTMCGLRKPKSGGSPDFEFRSRRRQGEESYVEGSSDWCPKCGALRFFLKSNGSKDADLNFMDWHKQKLANYMLEATAAGWLDDEPNGSESNKDGEDQNNLKYCKAKGDLRQEATAAGWQDDKPNGSKSNKDGAAFPIIVKVKGDLRQEARKVIRDEILASSQSDLLRDGAIGDHKGCSHSEDRKHQSRPAAKRRSKSLVNDTQRDVYKDVYVYDRASIDYERVVPVRQMQELDILNLQAGWERGCEAEPEKSRIPRRLTVKPDEMTRDMKKMEQKEKDEQLFNELQQKKHLVGKWENIRRRVEDEYARVKADLEELQQKRSMGFEYRTGGGDSSVSNIERQQGGARPALNEPQVEKELNKDEVIKITIIGDAVDSGRSPEAIGRMGATLNETCGDGEVKEAKKRSSHHNQQQLKPSVKTTAAAYALKPKHVSDLHMLVSTVQRARFRGFPADPLKTTADLFNDHNPPLAQFSTLPCTSKELIDLLTIKPEVLKPNVVRPLNVCRTPIFCPDAECRRMFFVSDFSDHLAHEHSSLAMERIPPSKAKTFFLDTRIIMLNKAKCSMVYFLKDKFIDKSSDKYADLLPVLVMTARINAPNFFSLEPGPIPGVSSVKRSPDQDIYMIWLTSIRPEDVKIVGTISVWPTSSKPIVEYLTVQTSEVYNVRSDQRLMAIYNSNRSMTLPGNVVNRMTDNGEHLLAVQVFIN